jgi:multiple sugar transport system substrate-binding protein
MMTEVNFLVIADTAEDLLPLRELLKPFEQEKSISIQLKRIGWDRAWQTLLMDAIEGKGPHISQIGSTWSATMAMLDALRVFSEDEAATMGAADQFLPAAWETVKLEKRPGIWAIPWSLYTFVLFYRKDLLERAHIDPEMAFTTPETMRETFDKLSKNGIAPWAFPSLRAYADLVHVASSWVRANGGEFMSSDGRMPLFANPEASQGLVQFFELFHFIPSSLRELSIEACTQAFARGQTAVLVGGLEVADDLLADANTIQKVRENLRVTTLPGVPWIGGDHLVIWKNARTDLKVEKSALELVRFLSEKETQVHLFQIQNILPARLDAYSEINFSLASTATTIQQVLERGRPHPPIRLWRRIESFLDEMLASIGKSVLEQPHQQVHEIVQPGLDRYAQKLTTMLKG